MSSPAGTDASFWEGLLAMAESIEASPRSIEDLRDYLQALDEGFAGSLDPAEHFPEYAAVRFCRSLRRQLERHLNG